MNNRSLWILLTVSLLLNVICIVGLVFESRFRNHDDDILQDNDMRAIAAYDKLNHELMHIAIKFNVDLTRPIRN